MSTAWDLAAADLAADGRDPTDSIYWHDPVAWIADNVRFPGGRGLTDYQCEILTEIPERKRVAVRGPHGLGKTSLSALGVLWFAETRDRARVDWKIPTTASQWRQLERYLWPEIHKWARLIDWARLGRPPFKRNVELLQLNLQLGYGQAFALASDDPTSIEGAHADHLFYLFDESKAISDATFDAAEGAFSTAGEFGTEAYALAVSTPGEPLGRFYDIHSRRPGTEDWWVRHVTLEEAIEAGRVTEEWSRQRGRLWGFQSAIYKNRVLGEFASSDQDGVIPLAWVELANERWRERYGDLATPVDPMEGTSRVVTADTKLTGIGVDVAREGADISVVAMRIGDDVGELRRYPYTDNTMTLTGFVTAAAEGHGRPVISVDVIGVGGGVVDRLREMGRRVVAFNASESTDMKDQSGEFGFTNKRSAAWWSLREVLDPTSGMSVALPPDDRLTGDLVAPRWRPMSGGRIQVEPKDDIKKRIGRSTDDGDAVVMVMWKERKATAARDWLEAQAPTCLECGQPNPLDATSCSKCGTKLADGEEAAGEQFSLTSGVNDPRVHKVDPPKSDHQRAVEEAVRQYGPQPWSPFQQRGWGR